VRESCSTKLGDPAHSLRVPCTRTGPPALSCEMPTTTCKQPFLRSQQTFLIRKHARRHPCGAPNYTVLDSLQRREKFAKRTTTPNVELVTPLGPVEKRGLCELRSDTAYSVRCQGVRMCTVPDPSRSWSASGRERRACGHGRLRRSTRCAQQRRTPPRPRSTTRGPVAHRGAA